MRESGGRAGARERERERESNKAFSSNAIFCLMASFEK